MLVALSSLLLSTAAFGKNTPFAHTLFAVPAALMTRVTLSISSPFTADDSVTHRNSTLSSAQIASTDTNRTIITQSARGDLPGVLTLALDINAQDGSVTGGEWALVVTDIQTPAHSRDHGEEEGPDVMVIQRGVLKGVVTGGAVVLNPDGTVGSASAIQLAINGGTLEFGDVSSGGGIVNGSDLQDPHDSSGNLSLDY
jgi:hypothetical protein